MATVTTKMDFQCSTNIMSGTIDAPLINWANFSNICDGYAMQSYIVYQRNYTGLLALLIGQEMLGAEAATNEYISDTKIKWAVQEEQVLSFNISSNYTGTIAVGNVVQFAVTPGVLEEGAIVQLEDTASTMLYVKRVVGELGSGKIYDFVVQGDAYGGVADASYFAVNRSVSLSGSAHPEGSHKGQDLIYQDKKTFYYNVMQTHRTQSSITGDALTQWVGYNMQFAPRPGQKTEVYRGYLPDVLMNNGQTLMQYHLSGWEDILLDGVGNFNVESGEIGMTDSSNKSVPTMSGLRQQLNKFAARDFYDVNSPVATLVKIINNAVSHISYLRNSDDTRFIILTGRGGLVVCRKAFQSLFQSQVQLIQDVSKSNADFVVPNTARINRYQTMFGMVEVHELDTLNKRGMKKEQLTIDGSVYPKSSFEMYMFPLYTYMDSQGKKVSNIGISYKGKGDVRRSLVAGIIPGMTGSNGIKKNIFPNMTAEAQRMTMDPRAGGLLGGDFNNTFVTGTDVDTMHCLTEGTLAVRTPKECFVLLPR